MQGGDVNDNPFDFDLWTDGTMEVNMQDVKLKPCPFCGGEAKVGQIFGHETVFCTECDACILPSPYDTKDELKKSIEAWNKRTSCDTCAMYYPNDGCMAGLAEEEVES